MAKEEVKKEKATRPKPSFHFNQFGIGEYDFTPYPAIMNYATVVRKSERPVLGRDAEIRKVLASLSRAEVSNVILLGDAGSGKTMLVQGTSELDDDRIYLEVNLAKMVESKSGEDGSTQMASRLKAFFDAVEQYRIDADKTARVDGPAKEIVVFIDEFHQITQLSAAATEAIKPILADSGVRGIKIIAATTYDEFRKYVSPNQALVERLQRINLAEPNQETVVSILKSLAKTYGVYDDIVDDRLYDDIYEYTNRYIPASSQPRKSILIFDSMLGWQKAFKLKMNRELLANVIYDSVGVNVNFNVDGRSIREQLNQRVLNQKYATQMIEQRLQIAVADIQDETRPMSSFLFTGSTGTGKTEMAKTLAQLLFGTERALIRFDMSDYSDKNAAMRFREELSAKTWARPNSIILLDEIEKSTPTVTRLLLQVLDDARLTDANNREVSFHNAYIIITTNAGSEIYESIAHYVDDEDGSKGLSDYTKVIRASLMADPSFPPELLNRIDSVISFQPLGTKTMESIARRELLKLKEKIYKKHGVQVEITEDVVSYLVYENLDKDADNGGARGVVRRLNFEVASAVARYINLYNASKVGVRIAGKMAYRDKSLLKSDARVEVVTIH